MKAMVFCAGFGTRMRPFTTARPKPAMPLFGRPLIGHTLRWLSGHGVTLTVINTHHLPDVMERTARQECPEGMRLVFSHEPEILGTGGGLVAARAHLEGDAPVLVVNGDAYLSLDVARALAVHRKHRPGATLVLTDDPRHAALFGVGVDDDGRILDFWGDEPRRRFAYTGIHVLCPEFLDALPAAGFACVKEAGWIPWLGSGGTLRSVVERGDWFDLGTPDRYLAAHAALWDRAGVLSGLEETAPGVYGYAPPGLELEGRAVIGPDVTVDGRATVRANAVIGAGVRVGDGAVVDGVVWGGATIPPGAVVTGIGF